MTGVLHSDVGYSTGFGLHAAGCVGDGSDAVRFDGWTRPATRTGPGLVVRMMDAADTAVVVVAAAAVPPGILRMAAVEGEGMPAADRGIPAAAVAHTAVAVRHTAAAAAAGCNYRTVAVDSASSPQHKRS